MKQTQNINLKKIIQNAIDIHVHIGPEIVPRKYTASSLIKEETGRLGGAVLKNHFYLTSPFIKEIPTSKLKLFGGLVLNNFVGGLNPEAIYAASLISDKPFVVWFPTINAQNFLKKSAYEIAPEWVQSKNFKGRQADKVQGIYLLQKGQLIDETLQVLQMIKQTNAVLATGHISAQESEKLVKQALEIGIKKIVITHPFYQRIEMDINLQKKLSSMGCFIEQSYSMCSIDKIPIEKIAQQVKVVGPKGIILSSDVGQPFSPSPSEALYMFAKSLMRQGITIEEVDQMMVKNPRDLLSIE